MAALQLIASHWQHFFKHNHQIMLATLTSQSLLYEIFSINQGATIMQSIFLLTNLRVLDWDQLKLQQTCFWLLLRYRVLQFALPLFRWNEFSCLSKNSRKNQFDLRSVQRVFKKFQRTTIQIFNVRYSVLLNVLFPFISILLCAAIQIKRWPIN